MQTAVEDNRRFKVTLGNALAIIVACFAISFPWGKVSPIPLLLGLLSLGAAVTTPLMLGRRRLSFMAVWLAAYAVVLAKAGDVLRRPRLRRAV